MPQLVITCHPNGSVETLLKDKVFDTRKLANTRKIERLSEIIPTDDGLWFCIHWLKGPLASKPHAEADGFYSTRGLHCEASSRIPYFYKTYEAAVQSEILVVNALRLKGHTFV